MKTNTTLSEHFQNHTIVETDAKSIDLTYIYMTSYCSGTCVDKLVVWPQTFPNCEVQVFATCD